MACNISNKCGGCEWLHLPYKVQLERKVRTLQELFELLSKHKNFNQALDEIDIIPADNTSHYRYKATTPFAPGKGGNILSGFFQKGTHRIIPVKKCPVESFGSREILNAVAIGASKLKISAYNEDTGRGCLRYAVLRSAHNSNDALLTLVTSKNYLPHSNEFINYIKHSTNKNLSIVQNINGREGNAILGFTYKTLCGQGFIHDSLLGVDFEIGPSSFYQTNPAQTDVLYSVAYNFAELTSGMRIFDAYSGIGTIGICAAKLFGPLQVFGVESIKGAVKCALRNAEINGLADSCEYICDDATGYLTRVADAGERYDCVFMDPPRAGSTPEFLGALLNIKPAKIIYISCNPKTLERDLHHLLDGGYSLKNLVAVDMFPNSSHVECVASLSRS